MATQEDYSTGHEIRVYSEKNPKLDLRLEFNSNMLPFIQQISGFDVNASYLFKWQRQIFAGDRLDEFERLLHLKKRDVFEEGAVVKYIDKKRRRALFFKVNLDTPMSSTVMVDKLKLYEEVPPFDLYLFELYLGFKKMVMLDLNIVDFDKLPKSLSEEHLA